MLPGPPLAGPYFWTTVGEADRRKRFALVAQCTTDDEARLEVAAQPV